MTATYLGYITVWSRGGWVGVWRCGGEEAAHLPVGARGRAGRGVGVHLRGRDLLLPRTET